MLGSKWQWNTVKVGMTLRFLTEGTWCWVGSEVIHGGMELRNKNKFDELDRFQKADHTDLNYRCFLFI